MPGTPTPNLSLIVPTVGGDNNQWGTELNTDLASIDNLLGTDKVVTVAATATITLGQPRTSVLAMAGAGGITLTLAPPVVGWKVTVKKVDASAGVVTVQGSGAAQIEGSSAYILVNQFQWATFTWDGSNWWVVG